MTQVKQDINTISPWLTKIRYAGILCSIALFSLILTIGINGKNEMKNLMENGIKAQATITKLEIETLSSKPSDKTKNQTQYIIYYSYQDNNGQNYESSRYSNKSYFEQKAVGQKLPLQYLPEEANKHELSAALQERLLKLSLPNMTMRALSIGMFAILFFELLRLIVAIMLKKHAIKQRKKINY